MSRPMSDTARSYAHRLTVLLLVVAIGLTVAAVAQASTSDAGRVAAGSGTPLDGAFYGHEGTVLLPFAEVDVEVGDPAESLDHGLAARDYEDPLSTSEAPLLPPGGGVLVPVAWSARATTDLGREGDTEPITIELVAGDERVEVAELALAGYAARSEALDPEPLAVALATSAELDDLRVEVTYDGLSQSLDVSTGEVDAGIAQPLYEDDLEYDLGCGEVADDCDFRAADRRSPLRPYYAGFTAGSLSFYPYSLTDGWANEGTLWASVYVQTFGLDYFQDAGGRTYYARANDRPQLVLGGRPSVRSQLEGTRGPSSTGTAGSVVFVVDVADAEDAEALGPLVITQSARLRPSAPLESVRARAELTPARP